MERTVPKSLPATAAEAATAERTARQTLGAGARIPWSQMSASDYNHLDGMQVSAQAATKAARDAGQIQIEISKPKLY